MDGSRIRKEKVAFSIGSGYLSTGPKFSFFYRETERDVGGDYNLPAQDSSNCLAMFTISPNIS